MIKEIELLFLIKINRMKKKIIAIIDSELIKVGAIKSSNTLYYHPAKNKVVNIIIDLKYSTARKNLIIDVAFDLNFSLNNLITMLDNTQFVFELNESFNEKTLKEFVFNITNSFIQKIDKYENLSNVISFLQGSKFEDFYYYYYQFMIYILLDKIDKSDLLKQKILSYNAVHPFQEEIIHETRKMNINRVNEILLINANKFSRASK